ncbi:MAG: hypothetical protein J6W40_05295 [Alphaproteobacteria bacterium]|nr:hypothetical protein [Alphaproteobacteria bacterium]
MRKLCAFLSAMFICLPVLADRQITVPPLPNLQPKEKLIYIDPEVTKFVIKKYISNMSKAYLPEYTTDKKDSEILAEFLDSYNQMLTQTEGLVSSTLLNEACTKAFSYLKRTVFNSSIDFSKDVFVYNKCLAFGRELVTTHTEQRSDCKYEISKVNGSQSRIRYVNKEDGHGFVRKNGTIAWRFFNPGALRDSPYKCTRLSTSPNGPFAAFDSELRGRMSLRYLLETSPKYEDKTVSQIIPIYAPSKENDPARYVRNLRALGVNVNKVVSELTEAEWDNLLDSIAQIEGWNNAGTVEYF